MTATTEARTPLSLGRCLQWVAGLLAIASAGIHFGVMGEHAGVSWSHGLFFAVVAWAQLAFAAWIVLRPTRTAAWFGIAGNAAVIAVWVVDRTVGIAIGSDGGAAAVGFVDSLCALLEVGIIVSCVGLLAPSVANQRLGRTAGSIGIAVVGVLSIALATAAFTPAFAEGGSGTSPDGHDHSAGAAGAPHDHGGGSTSAAEPVAYNGDGFPLYGTSPCELAGPPASKGQVTDAEGHNHRGPYAQQPVTAAERKALMAQQAQARDVALRYPTVKDAEAAGYRMSTVYVPCIGAHYTNTGLVARFDPAAPSELLYDGVTPDARIVGLSYLVFSPSGAPEGFAGPNDLWHQHNFNGGLCMRGGVVVGNEQTTKAECAARGGRKVALDGIWMVHDWVVPGFECSWGVFAGECPELGGRTGGTAWDEPKPRAATGSASGT
jgi:hypothetical protein